MWQSQVDKFVKEFTDLGKIFTAYDVTKAVQEEQLNSGITQPTRHLEMRNYIHAQVCNVPGYMRKLELLPGGAEAYHYKPMATGGLIPNSVGNIPVNFNAANKIFAPVPVSFSQSVNSVNNPPTTKLCNRDKRGSISIPSRFVTNLFPTAEKVDVYDGSSHLFIQPHDSNNKVHTSNFITTYTIDSHKNIRVTKKTLSKLNSNGPYAVQLSNGGIIIE